MGESWIVSNLNAALSTWNDKLAEIWDTNKKTPAIVEFVDIAGLVKGASQGAGLGNILHDPWHKIWNAPACRRVREESAKMEHICQLGTTVPAQGGL